MKNYLIILIVKIILHEYPVAAVDFAALNCSIIKNPNCEQTVIQALAVEVSPKGSKELDIVQLLPYTLENVRLTVLNSLEITLLKGYAYGIETCNQSVFRSDITHFYKSVDTLCKRIEINGTYSIKTLKKIFGDITGTGKGSIVLDDWHFNFTFPFDLEKKSDGKIYTVPYFNKAVYSSEILKKATVKAERISMNGHDATKPILALINNNWRLIFKSFLDKFHSMTMDYYYGPYAKVYAGIPATVMFTDDFEPYLKENRGCENN